MREQPEFLPISLAEAGELGIDHFDVILVSGDAYVDHSSFAAAVIGRVLWDAGYSVGIVAQPDWKKADDFRRLGSPRLFFGITSGNVDSMVNNFTAALKRRRSDIYSPGGALLRPDRAAIVYADRVHSLFPEVPVILGGIEASLRRFAHYDYWSDSVRRSILADAPADLIVYGMGERPVKEVARRLENGERIDEIRDVAGTTVKEPVALWRGRMSEAGAGAKGRPEAVAGDSCLIIPGFDQVSSDKREYARAFALHYGEQDPFRGRPVVQPHPKTVIVQNPPAKPLSTEELDRVYELDYSRWAHPSYRLPVPAIEPVRFSITSHRGCFGSCSFCALTHHQGRIVQSRSDSSILREAARLAGMPEFKGIIQDVGGPTANMYGMSCPRWGAGACADKFCRADCPSLDKDHFRQVKLLRALLNIPGVKRVFIGSGIRHDLLLADTVSGPVYLEQLCRNHVSGHLKIAPEHISRSVTDCMNKPPREALDAFREAFAAASLAAGKEQYILPYFMSGHPGCTAAHMAELAEYMREGHMYPEQVQDFTPTPMTVSTTMYYTGLNPFTLLPVHVPRGREKRIQRAMLRYREPENYELVREGLLMAGRGDLIGGGRQCLIEGRRTGQRTGRSLSG
ncbi:MAG TPA: YgiQ family radical SAM protein [Methanothrix sp.]|nr:YgiQ family radical SAM protein [Methanothrix sp.]HPC88854.1 YgiQ family radical SAM protein [Methanothrix sp.]HQI69081.1 YgiQ family radical SAM protein [Methanothrix sp.]HRS85979.1 YgiQ family radical SAM protein [Methanothrix sp.]HRT17956.1 YgiQ family radical SAM protein [Methanothrix sp.]